MNVEIIIGGIVISILSAIGGFFLTQYFVKTDSLTKLSDERLRDRLASLDVAFNKHRDECDKIPKSLIIEKIEALCEKTDEYQQNNEKTFNRIEKEITVQRDRTHELANVLTKVALRLDDRTKPTRG